MQRSLWPALTLLLVGSACGPRATDGGFDSANPAAKLYAIESAYETRDTAAIPELVEQLDSDDPAVRLLAISALTELTGDTLGYDHTDPPELRRAAIRRWQEAVTNGDGHGPDQRESTSKPEQDATIDG